MTAARETGREPKLPHFMVDDHPPLEVLYNAECSPETAHLFDPLERGLPGERQLTREEYDQGYVSENTLRLRAAAAICEACPLHVKDLCVEWAYQSRSIGVFGGMYFGRNVHTNSKKPIVIRQHSKPSKRTAQGKRKR